MKLYKTTFKEIWINGISILKVSKKKVDWYQALEDIITLLAIFAFGYAMMLMLM